MQNEFHDNWSKLCQCMSKPMIELTQLNINTLNNLSMNSNAFGELSQAKKPDEYLAAQIKLAKAAYLEATRYSQKAIEIGMNAFSEAGKVWAESLSKAANRASDHAGSDKHRE